MVTYYEHNGETVKATEVIAERTLIKKQCNRIYFAHPAHEWGERGDFYYCDGLDEDASPS